MDSMEWLYQIADECGEENIVLGNLYIGNCTLERHWNNAENDLGAYAYYKNSDGVWNIVKNTKISTAIADEDWDYIVLQNGPTNNGVPDSYDPYLENLIDYVKSRCPGAKILWHMSWAYESDMYDFGWDPDGASDYRDLYSCDQMTMYNAIIAATKEKIVSNSNIDAVIPSGTAVQNVRTSFIGDTLTRDGIHMSYETGRFIVAMTWYKKITGRSIDNVAFFPEYTGEAGLNAVLDEFKEEYRAVICEAVNNAVEKPFEVTCSSYTE